MANNYPTQMSVAKRILQDKSSYKILEYKKYVQPVFTAGGFKCGSIILTTLSACMLCLTMTDYGCGFDYLSIWSKQHIEPSNYFIQNNEDFDENSFVFKSFRNEFEEDHAFSVNGLKLLRKMRGKNGEIMITKPGGKVNHLENVPGYSPLHDVRRKSLLTYEEMNECFNIILSLKGGSMNQEQLKRYNVLREKIIQEQNDYLTLCRNIWLKENFKRHTEILPDIVHLINNLWKEKLLRVSKYPAFYSQTGLISLVYQCTNKVEMNPMKVLHVKGKQQALFEPLLKKFRVSLHSALNEIKKGFEDRMYTPIAEVSEDKLAEKLAIENSALIVLSSSAFVTILCNHYPTFYNSWDLPITVREYTTQSGAKKKIIFIDEVLPPKAMNLYDRNQWFSKIGCEYVLKHQVKEPRLVGKKFTGSSFQFKNICDNFDSDEEDCESKVKKMNEDGNSLLSEPGASVNEDLESSCSNHSDDNLVIADTSCTKPEEEVPPNIYLAPSKKKKKKEKIPHLSYTLWSLKKDSQSYLSKMCSKDLTLLLRCREGYRKLPADRNDVTLKWIISSKMEYQNEFGAEKMSLDELTHEWGNLFLRQNTKLLRVRMNPANGEVIMFEKKTLAEVGLECQNLYNVNMVNKLGSTYSVLEKLSNLFPGRYHLSHSPKNEAFVPLFKEAAGPSVFNLHSLYNIKVDDVAPERSPWVPIDTNIVTPMFRYLHRVPATFTPHKAPQKRLKGQNKKQTNIKKGTAGKKKLAKKKKNKQRTKKKKCVTSDQ